MLLRAQRLREVDVGAEGVELLDEGVDLGLALLGRLSLLL